jgi:phosphoadenosine phosphosulfate reductase
MSRTSPDGVALPGRESIGERADRLEALGPAATLSWAFAEYGEAVAIATGFGVEGAALVDMAVKLNPRPYVFFIDTGFHFAETLALRTRMERRYGIDIHAIAPDLTPDEQEDTYGARLWHYDPDFCCSMRKVEPLERFLAERDAWITAIRRNQTAARATARAVEWDDRFGLVKVNPLVSWTREMVWDYVLRNEVPYNPLHDRGYPSVGCTHCTRAVRPGEDERAGRWSGHAKTECGLHVRKERP